MTDVDQWLVELALAAAKGVQTETVYSSMGLCQVTPEILAAVKSEVSSQLAALQAEMASRH